MSSFKRRLIEATIGRVMFRSVRVERTQALAPRFWRVELGGDALRGMRSAPGDKLQVVLDDGPRTYSPFSVDAARGSLSVVVYAHGDTPGAQWGPTARVDEVFQVFGPRPSLPLSELGSNIVLVGDETTFGVARALHESGANARYVFEVDTVGAATAALAQLEIPNAKLVARKPDDAHYGQLDDNVRAALRDVPDATLVLTGKATSIKTVRAALKAKPVAHAGQRVKAYWAPGKRGMD